MSKAISIDPNYKEGYLNFAIYFKLISDVDHALINIQKAIDIYPRYKEAYNEMGTIYKLSGNYTEAF